MVWVQKTFFSNSEYISACFVGPECSVVVLQNVRFCLSIHLSVLPAFWKYVGILSLFASG